MSRLEHIEGHPVYLTDPEPIPPCRKFVGRETELRLCRAAWGVEPQGKELNLDAFPLHFRLEGPPGVGKNEIVYEIARRLDIPFYMIQGHEEFTPEDLALLLVPDAEQEVWRNEVPLALRASPLATAIYEGGLFFFDEINRVPEKALSPLASVLDGRQHIYSAMTGIHIKPRGDLERRRFRFCCALNPSVRESGRGVLPDYIEERTLPVIEVGYPSADELFEIVGGDLPSNQNFLRAFREWYGGRARRDISVRQALSLIRYALNTSVEPGRELEAIRSLESMVFRDTAAPGK